MGDILTQAGILSMQLLLAPSRLEDWISERAKEVNEDKE